MSNFETDNQDKRNMVGDAKVMSDAVDVEQELIRVKTALSLAKEVIALKEESIKNLLGALQVATAALESIRGES